MQKVVICVKKLIVIICCLCLLLAACGAQPADAPQYTLQVGFGRADITPDFKMPLQGYPSPQNRIFSRVLDPIYATCIAFSDGETTVLLYTLDLTGSCWDAVALAKADIQQETGVPFKNIMVSATHNHSSPSLTESANRERYVALLRQQMLTAARDAIADLKDAQLYTGSIETEGLNAVRHYMLSDGSVCGDNFGDNSGKTYTGHVGRPDRVLQVLRISRDGGKDVVLANWQAHPHRTGGATKTDLSADIIGPMRSFVEANGDCHFAYFTGASGNLNSTSRIGSENSAMDYVAHGTELGQYACLALTDMTPAATGKVQIREVEYTPVTKTGSSGGPAVSLNGISIGDVAFAVVPYEMFSQSGEYIKENSPFQMTFLATCANFDGGYMPTRECYYYDGKESYEGSKCRYEVGTAEILAQQYVELLTQLHGTRSAGTASAQAASQVYCMVDSTADGVRFLRDGQPVTLQVPEEAQLTAIRTHRFVGLELDGTRVTRVYPLSELLQSLLCRDYCVQTMGGTTVKVNANERLSGKELVLKLKDIPVYNVSQTAAVPGEPTELQKGDLVTAVNDENGDLLCVYVTGREGVYIPVQRHCEHCGKDVEFLNWFRSNALPTTSGHYYLEGDVILTGTQIIGAHDVTLDLNGFTVKQTTEGEGIYWMRDSSKLTLLDSVGTGTMVPSSTADDPDLTIWKGLCVRMETNAQELNVYGGTYDGSAATAQHSTTLDNMSGTMNIYGGTFIGGSTYGAGGATLMVQGRTNIYGGTFVGGHSADTDYITKSPKGGGSVFVADVGTLTVYGGTFQGGTADINGGLLLSYGKVVLKGGSFEGGAAGGSGSTFYFDRGSTLVLDGDFSVNGEAVLAEEVTLEITKNCPRKVTRRANGILNIR